MESNLELYTREEVETIIKEHLPEKYHNLDIFTVIQIGKLASLFVNTIASIGSSPKTDQDMKDLSLKALMPLSNILYFLIKKEDIEANIDSYLFKFDIDYCLQSILVYETFSEDQSLQFTTTLFNEITSEIQRLKSPILMLGQ